MALNKRMGQNNKLKKLFHLYAYRLVYTTLESAPEYSGCVRLEYSALESSLTSASLETLFACSRRTGQCFTTFRLGCPHKNLFAVSPLKTSSWLSAEKGTAEEYIEVCYVKNSVPLSVHTSFILQRISPR